MKSVFFTEQGEFRLLWLYIPMVLFHWVFHNWYMPALEIVWDSVFYKTLASGLFHITRFDLRDYFPMPPLYPLVLAPAFFAASYQAVELIHSLINPALYFLGLFPFYLYARMIFGVRGSVALCFLFAAYPGCVFSQWTMSENLAVPLVLWSFWLTLRLLGTDTPQVKHGAWLGLALAGILLTRIFLIVFCFAILSWLLYKTVRCKRDWRPVGAALGVTGFVVFGVWWGLGYISLPGTSLLYADFNQESVVASIGRFSMVFLAHWTGLWLEGGLLVLPALLTGWGMLRLGYAPVNRTVREGLALAVWILLVLTVSVAGFYVKRWGIEPWSVSLRYIFYSNLIALPLALSGFGAHAAEDHQQRRRYIFSASVAVLLCAAGFLIPEGWDKLINNHDYAANAPSLDFLYQFRNEGVWFSFFVLSLLGGGMLAAGRISRKAGGAILGVCVLYIQLCALDYIATNRFNLYTYFDGKDIHALCAQLEAGNWEGIEIYHGQEIPYLDPNLHYWINHSSTLLPENYAELPRPFLFVGRYAVPGGRVVYDSGGLRVLLFE
ncbi:MAG: glycosyltransferase family 39 protein [bacterium]|jgi:hypothetical protein|nr:glycosyltransferase family 39 protein [bacterium]